VICLAPTCETETGNPYTCLCKSHLETCESAMMAARELMLESMVEGRAEVEAFLSGNGPMLPVQWFMTSMDGDHRPIKDIAASIYLGDNIGFVSSRSIERLRSIYPDDHESRLAPWIVSHETADAWKAHAAPFLEKAIRDALSSFPKEHAARELGLAILGKEGYEQKDFDNSLEDMADILSNEGYWYLTLKYEDDPSYLFDADDPDPLWFKHRVLPDDIMMILEAVRQWWKDNDAA
jgi:hypothetical protein